MKLTQFSEHSPFRLGRDLNVLKNVMPLFSESHIVNKPVDIVCQKLNFSLAQSFVRYYICNAFLILVFRLVLGKRVRLARRILFFIWAVVIDIAQYFP